MLIYAAEVKMLTQSCDRIKNDDNFMEAIVTMKRIKLILASIVAIMCIISFSAGATLRTAVFFYSPRSAVTMEYEKSKRQDSKGVLYEITENIPMEKQTRNYLMTWVVYSFGPFHFAMYYGEG